MKTDECPSCGEEKFTTDTICENCRDSNEPRKGGGHAQPLSGQAKRIAELEAQLDKVKRIADERHDGRHRAEVERDAALSQVAVLRAAIGAMGPMIARCYAKVANNDTDRNAALATEKRMNEALASTQSTADAYRASIRREALEEAAAFIMEASAAWEKAHELTGAQSDLETAEDIADVAHDFAANFSLDMTDRALASRGTP